MRQQVLGMLRDKSDDARRVVAADVGARLESARAEHERRAAEELARVLAEDAIEAVRVALAVSVRQCRYLPRDVALRLAHDVEAVAAPFLEVTEVFSEADLQQLALTVLEGAQAAIARRRDLPESVSHTLAEIGAARTIESLLANPSAQLGDAALSAVIFRFEHGQPWVLEKLADRPALPARIAARLIGRVSEAASRKLAERYQLPDYTEPLVAQARTAAVLKVAEAQPRRALAEMLQDMHKRGELSPFVVLRALRQGHYDFVEIGLALRAQILPDSARKLMSGGGFAARRLCYKAGIPEALHKDFLAGFEPLTPPPATSGESGQP